MHILILNHYAGSPNYGMEYRPYYLSKEWIKQGHTVTIIAADNSHIRRLNPAPKGNIWEENIDGIKYIWIKTRQYKGNGVKRILNMMDYIRGVYHNMRTFVNLKPDVIIASSTYPLDNYPAYKLARKIDAQYIYEVHDLWPLSPQILGGYSKYHPFIFIMQIAENFAYKHVDKVVSLPPCTKEHMIEHGLDERKFFHVNNGIYIPEVENPDPLSEDLYNKLPKNKRLIGYCGTIGKANVLHRLVETARLAVKEIPDAFFVIVGDGPEKDNLLELIKKYDLSNIKIYNAIPKKQVQSFLRMMDINIILLNDNGLFKFGISPNKLFDYMYSARPVLQSVDGVIPNDIINEAKCGFTCSSNSDSIIETLGKMLNMSKMQLDEMGLNGHKFVLSNYTYEILANKFLKAIEV